MTNEAVQKAVSAYCLSCPFYDMLSLFCICSQIFFFDTSCYYYYLYIYLFFSGYFQAAALKGSDHRRATNVSARLDAQQKKLNLPVLPTTTIGSFPQTIELRRVRREYKAKK